MRRSTSKNKRIKTISKDDLVDFPSDLSDQETQTPQPQQPPKIPEIPSKTTQPTITTKEDETLLHQIEKDTSSNSTSIFIREQSHSSFDSLLLREELKKSISECGFEHPSEIQIEAIPHAILGIDLICQAKSGMGKTAVFVLSLLQQTKNSTIGIESLVIAHTRELTHQIHSEFLRFSKYLPFISCIMCTGGLSLSSQISQLNEAHSLNKTIILVGTPGRLTELASKNFLNLSKVKHFVIDECDKSLEKADMRSDIQRIFNLTPFNKQTILLSATFSENAKKVAKTFAPKAKEIFIEKSGGEKGLVLKGLKQFFHNVKESEKYRTLLKLMDSLEYSQCIIFISTSDRASRLKRLICKDEKIQCLVTHGKIDMKERIKVYESFRKFESRILITTDLFGRGVDVENVNLVINYDMPMDSKVRKFGGEENYVGRGSDAYLHRVGRAGRFGTRGLAISFVSTEEDKKVLEDVQDRFEIKMKEMPDKIDPESYMNL